MCEWANATAREIETMVPGRRLIISNEPGQYDADKNVPRNGIPRDFSTRMIYVLKQWIDVEDIALLLRRWFFIIFFFK